MHPATSRQIIAQNGAIKRLYGAVVVLVILATVCMIVWGNVDCYSYRSCTYWYSYYTWDCNNAGTNYCCSSSYRYCGDNYCLTKPSDSSNCDFLWAIATGFFVIAFILCIVALCKTAALRRQAQAAAYAQINNPAAPGPHNNIVIYSDQAQANPYNQPPNYNMNQGPIYNQGAGYYPPANSNNNPYNQPDPNYNPYRQQN